MDKTVIDEAVRERDESRMRWCRMYTLLTGREDVFHLSTEAIADHALRAAQDAAVKDGAHAGPVDCQVTAAENERDADRQRWRRLYSLVMQADPPDYMSDEEIAHVAWSAVDRAQQTLVQAHRALDPDRSVCISIDRLAQEVTGAGEPAFGDRPDPRPTNPYTPEQLEIVGLRAQLTEERIARAREQGETRRTMSLARAAVVQLSEDFTVYRSGEMDGSEQRWRGRIERGLEALLHEILGADE